MTFTKAWFSPLTGSLRGRRCRCFRYRCRNPRLWQRFLQTDTRFTTSRSIGPILCSTIASHMCLPDRDGPTGHHARQGCSVLTRPSIISGKPVTSATSFEPPSPASRSAAWLIRRSRAILPRARQAPFPSSIKPGFVRYRKQGAAQWSKIGHVGPYEGLNLCSRPSCRSAFAPDHAPPFGRIVRFGQGPTDARRIGHCAPR